MLSSGNKGKDYAEMAFIFERVINVIDHFDSYNHIEQIADLSNRVKVIKNELCIRVKQDFEDSFSNPFTKVIFLSFLYLENNNNYPKKKYH